MTLKKLFSKLGLIEGDSLIMLSDEDWIKKVSFPSRVVRLLRNTEKWAPKAIFVFDNKPLILFFENPENKEELHKAVWNFNESPIVVISEKEEITVYNGFAIDEKTQLLKKLGGGGALDDLNYFELVTGKTFEKYQDDFNYLHRVDYRLLTNIENAQNELLNRYHCNRKTANALLGKIIFIRYLIDRKVRLNFEEESRTWENEEFCQLLLERKRLYQFFDYLHDKKRGFNGDLFPIDKEAFEKIPDGAFRLIKRLLEGGDIKTGQQSLFQLYDFSILPIEFISNVYERFIGKENQAEAGAYYTPTFLVDYIISQTIAEKLNRNIKPVTCKVLDPACGSGIFLVETLRKIIEKYLEVNGRPDTEERFKDIIKGLARENIFGIDKDESAVQVAIFSVYLTLLDYQEPPEIETFKFPTLLNTNFFVADFFDLKADFNNQLKNVEFDFIVGNPPWAGGKKGLDVVGKEYILQRKEREHRLEKECEIAVNNNEIVEGFSLRVSDFCSSETKIALVIKSSILYNRGYKKRSRFRLYWLQEFFIDEVFELAPVRKEVFNKSSDPSVAPAAIIFYRYANGRITDNNEFYHITLKPSKFFTLFKVFTLNRSDFKTIRQSLLKEYDWLWKTLVYGSYLDFTLLKRIKEKFPTIDDIISDEKRFVEGTGIQYSKSPTYNSEHLIGSQFLDARGVFPFFIDTSKISTFNKPKVHRIRTQNGGIFKAPMILIRKGINTQELSIRSAISQRDLLFKDSLTSIAPLNVEDTNVLYNIQAVFSSDIMTYYAIYSFAFVGIEREQTQNYDKFSLPYLSLDIRPKIEQVENLKIQLYKKTRGETLNDYELIQLKEKIEETLAEINNGVLQELKLSDCERALLDYSLKVAKPFITKNETLVEDIFSPTMMYDTVLTEYARLYTKRFGASLIEDNNLFTVKIWHTKQIVGMFFKLVAKTEFKDDIEWEDKRNDVSGILSFLAKISSEKITDELFVQKDVRGFEKDYFYIFKPNEKRLWHKAIGYLDVNEFADAILKSGIAGL